MKGRKLIHFCGPDKWNLDVRIGFVDYTGHWAKGGGSHYTATHELRVSPVELYEILKDRLITSPGNEPDLVGCDRCGVVFFGDELKLEWESERYLLLCVQCLEKGETDDNVAVE